MKDIFERKEIKFCITKEQKEELLFRLQETLLYDQFPEYTIYSVYYDSVNQDLLRASVSKPVYKEKLRMRSYQEVSSPNDPVFLELKKKYQGIVYKRRVDFTFKDAVSFLRKPEGSDVTRHELARVLRSENLKPAVSLRYHREAFIWKGDPELRITFDDEIFYRTQRHGLSKDSADVRLLENDLCLMEIKCKGSLPLMLCRILSEMKIQSSSFSKAGTAYGLEMESFSKRKGARLT